MIVWCPSCGIVWTVDGGDLPLCRHNVLDPTCRPRRTEPIPSWHPYHPAKL